MKPAWDQLTEEFEGNSNVVIADVDCTKDESKDLCSKYGVRGYPTIKYFTSSTDPMGDKYEGGRDFSALKDFASENLGPSCGPDNLDLCSEEEVAEIEKFQAMDAKELQKVVDESAKAVEDAEANFKAEVEKLQAKYNDLMKEKDTAIETAGKVPGLKMMKIVLASSKSKNAKDEL